MPLSTPAREVSTSCQRPVNARPKSVNALSTLCQKAKNVKCEKIRPLHNPLNTNDFTIPPQNPKNHPDSFCPCHTKQNFSRPSKNTRRRREPPSVRIPHMRIPREMSEPCPRSPDSRRSPSMRTAVSPRSQARRRVTRTPRGISPEAHRSDLDARRNRQRAHATLLRRIPAAVAQSRQHAHGSENLSARIYWASGKAHEGILLLLSFYLIGRKLPNGPGPTLAYHFTHLPTPGRPFFHNIL